MKFYMYKYCFTEEYEIHKKNFQSSYRNGMDMNGKGKFFDKHIEDDDDEEDLNVVDDSEENSNEGSSGVIVSDVHEAREKYKKSILHRYLADSVDAVNALKDDKEKTSRSSDNEDSVQESSFTGNLEDDIVESKKVKSPKLRKRKISDSSYDNDEKLQKTQHRAKSNKTISRSLDSVANYSHSNSSSNTSSLRRKSTQQEKISTSKNKPR